MSETQGEQRLSSGQAVDLAIRTLQAQHEAILSTATGNTLRMVQSFGMLLDANLTMIAEAANADLDDYNSLCDQYEKAEREEIQAKADAVVLAKELRALREIRATDETKIRQILNTHEQQKLQLENYRGEAQEAARLRTELARIQKKEARHDESLEKMRLQYVKAQGNLDRLSSKLRLAVDSVFGCNDLMRYVRQTLISEGLCAEHEIDQGGIKYWLYRRPANIAEMRIISANEPCDVSLDHMYYWRVETNAGHHVDVLPLRDGGTVYGKAKAIPAPIKKVIEREFSDSTLFDWDHAKMRTDALTDKLARIEIELGPLRDLLDDLKSEAGKAEVIHRAMPGKKTGKKR